MPPMLIEVVQAAIQICDHTEYFPLGTCRSCGGRLSGYDSRAKRFAVLSNIGGDQPIEVIIHRAYCRECGRILLPEEPFYPGTRIGSPVVDLCHALSFSLSSGHISGILDRMGVKVDRWSVRSYCNLPITPPQTVEAFGMQLPVSIIALSSLAGGVDAHHRVNGEDVLAACNYPSRCRQIP